jgi:hypothetical protein
MRTGEASITSLVMTVTALLPAAARGRFARRSAPSAPADPGAISGAIAGVSFIAGLAGAMARSEHAYPRPGSTGAEIRRYFTQGSRAPFISIAGQLISAASLARFTASVVRLAGRAGPDARALQAVAVAGGAIATAGLAASAGTAAALTTDRSEDPDRASALARRAFLVGGPIHGVGFGLLIGVLGLAGLRTGELPRPVARTALASVPPNLLGPLYLLAEPAGWFIPAGRFPGLIVAGIAGARLSRPAHDGPARQ